MAEVSAGLKPVQVGRQKPSCAGRGHRGAQPSGNSVD